MTTKTKTQKLVSLMRNGKVFTAAQIARRTGLQNVSSTVHRLRVEGIRIYTIPSQDSRGNRTCSYRMAA